MGEYVANGTPSGPTPTATAHPMPATFRPLQHNSPIDTDGDGVRSYPVARRTTMARGGRVRLRDCMCPCQATGLALTPPRLPWPLPP
jgi:hypothetical protein